MISEQRLFELAKTRPDMACIFQISFKKYTRFVVYKTYIVCYGLETITSYNKKIEESGYDPEFNVIYSFFIENDTL